MIDILLIEDNLELGGLVGSFLKAEGFRFCHVVSGEEGIAFLEKHRVGIILLDVMLPGMNGVMVCNKLRQTFQTPILIISAKSDKETKMDGLVAGADDFIEKPFDIDLLIAKIKSIYRRNYTSLAVLKDGDLEVNLEERKAYKDHAELALSAKEYDLLVLFLQNDGKTLHKEWIFNQIWGYDSFSEPSTLTVHIKWLREKIEVIPKEPERIKTVWGVGYRYERDKG